MKQSALAELRAHRKLEARRALQAALNESLNVRCELFTSYGAACALSERRITNTCAPCKVRLYIRRALMYMEDPIRKTKTKKEKTL